MELLKKLPVAAIVALIVTLAGIAPANAQEAKDEFQQLVEDCQAELDYSPEGSLDRVIDEAITPDDWEDTVFETGEKIDCTVTQGVLHPVKALSAGASEFWGDPVGDFTKAVLEGNNQALQTCLLYTSPSPRDS